MINANNMIIMNNIIIMNNVIVMKKIKDIINQSVDQSKLDYFGTKNQTAN